MTEIIEKANTFTNHNWNIKGYKILYIIKYIIFDQSDYFFVICQ